MTGLGKLTLKRKLPVYIQIEDVGVDVDVGIGINLSLVRRDPTMKIIISVLMVLIFFQNHF